MAEPPHRVDGSMSLLVDTTGEALDPAYGEAARRKAEQGSEPAARAASPRLAVVLLLVVGLGTGVASAQVRRSAHAADGARARLVADVREQTAQTDALVRELDALRTRVAGTRDTVLGDGALGRQLSARVSALEAATGQTPVSGPGLVVTLDDASDAASGGGNGRGGQLGDGRIYDRDVQDVVNALWAAGAEAVSINGQRLTALTAIRSAGEAVLVDFRPLSPPYRISAIGDVDAMEPAFADSATARRFVTYTSLYGLGFGTRRAKHLALPAAAPLELHSSQAVTSGGPS